MGGRGAGRWGCGGGVYDEMRKAVSERVWGFELHSEKTIRSSKLRSTAQHTVMWCE